MGKVISSEKLSETLTISECTDGFWLYDYTRGMNLSMKAKSKEAALLEALKYYQNRLKTVETDFNALQSKVSALVEQFQETEDY